MGDPSQDLQNERNGLAESHGMMDDILAQAQSSLDGLKNQNYMITQTKKRMGALASALGMSNSVVGMIERRHAMDQLIVYGGMALTLFIMVSLYWWLYW